MRSVIDPRATFALGDGFVSYYPPLARFKPTNRKRIVGVEPGVSVRSFVALRKRRANFIDGAQMKERAVGG